MIIELHIIQNFAPSCLNRDDTNSPKDCEFGGHRRARLSSQCSKRGIRTCFEEAMLLPSEYLARRSKRIVEEVSGRLAKEGRDAGHAAKVVEAALKGAKLTVKDDGKTQYLLFLGEGEIAALTNLCETHWDALAKVAPPEDDDDKKTARKRKSAAKEAVPKEVQKELADLLDGGKAADLALFGRMLADLPDKNIDAACQVAHAISTNKVSAEFDFYTAVDDLKPEDTAGADMMGTVEFNSPCFYRYANVDVQQLTKNLHGDGELAHKTVEAFIRAAVTAIPTGKQNSMAAQNPPSFILAVVRDSGLWSLANAFVDPVRPNRDGDLVHHSIARLEQYWDSLVKVYGDDQIRGHWALALDDGSIKSLPKSKNLGALVQNVMEVIRAENGGQGGGQ